MSTKKVLNFSGFTGGVTVTDEAPLPGDKLFLGTNAIIDAEGFLKKRNGSTALGADPPFPDAAITSVHGVLNGAGQTLLVQSGTSLKMLTVTGGAESWVTPSGAAPSSPLELRSAQYGSDLYLFNGTDFLKLRGGTVANLGFTTIGKSRRCCMWMNRLWAYDDPTNDDRLYYSPLDAPDVFTGEFYRIAIRSSKEGRFVGVVPTTQALFLVKTNSIYAFTGSPSIDADMSAADIQQMFTSNGCIAADTMVATGTGLIGLSYDGIYLFQIGVNPENLTKNVFNDFMKDININKDYLHKCSAVFFDQKYIMMYPSGSSTYANKGLIIDLRFDNTPVTFFEGLNLVDMTRISYSFAAPETVVLASDTFGDSSLNTGLWEPKNSVSESDFGDLMKNCLRIQSKVVKEGDTDPDKEADPDTATGDGTPGNPFRVRTPANLDAVRNNLSWSYRQLNNIDASGLTWVPTGNTTTLFTGVYDGNEYKISGLILPNQAYSGLFGANSITSTLKNIYLRNVNGSSVTGDYVGALAGFNSGLIQNCNSTGTIKGGNSVGGLVGYHSGVIELGCWSSCAVSGANNVGGLAGYHTGTSSASYASGNVNGLVGGDAVGGYAGVTSYNTDTNRFINCYAVGAVSGAGRVGGFVGTVSAGAGVTKQHISKCCATGAVSGTGAGIGGFAGSFSSTVTANQCYATGTVSKAGSSSNSMGGFVGTEVGPAGTVLNCYATGAVDGLNNTGGFTGVGGTKPHTNCYSTGSVIGTTNTGGFSGSGTVATNCFWDTQTSGQAASTIGTGQTTAEMRAEATYTEWDFTTIWAIAEGVSYPAFKAAANPPPPIPPIVPGEYEGGVKCLSTYELTLNPLFNMGGYFTGSTKATEGFYLGMSTDADPPANWDSTSVLTNPIGFKIINNRIWILFSSGVTDTGVNIALNKWLKFKITASNGSGAKFEYHNGITWATIADLTGGPVSVSMRPFVYCFKPPADGATAMNLYVRGFSIDQGIEAFTAIERPVQLYAGSSVSPGKIYRLFVPETFDDDGANILFEIGGGWDHSPMSGQLKKTLQGTVEFEAADGDLNLSLYADNYVVAAPNYTLALSQNTPWSGVMRKLLRFRTHLNYKRLRWRLHSLSKTDVRVYALQILTSAKRSWRSTDTEV